MIRLYCRESPLSMDTHHELLRRAPEPVLVHVSQGDVELDFKLKMVCFIFTKYHVRLHFRTVRFDFSLPAHYIQRALEACRVSTRKQLLWIGCPS